MGWGATIFGLEGKYDRTLAEYFFLTPFLTSLVWQLVYPGWKDEIDENAACDIYHKPHFHAWYKFTYVLFYAGKLFSIYTGYKKSTLENLKEPILPGCSIDWAVPVCVPLVLVGLVTRRNEFN